MRRPAIRPGGQVPLPELNQHMAMIALNVLDRRGNRQTPQVAY